MAAAAAPAVPVNLAALVAAQERVAQANRLDAAPERTELSRALLARPAEEAVGAQPYTFQAPSSLSLPLLEAVEGRAFPKGIQDAIAAAVCDVQMGLFPELSRAWIAVDNRLFLWNYYRNDYNVFADLDQLIISVGVAKPKATAFAPSVPDYVLVITTLVEVVLVRVDLINGLVSNALELRHSKITAVTDGVPMRAVKGTEDGRIFLGGHDGALYELVYEAPSLLHSLGIKRQCLCVGRSGNALSNTVGWLVPSIVKLIPRLVGGGADAIVAVEVDPRRRLLYTLSKAGSVLGYNIAGEATMDCFARVDKIAQALKTFVESERSKSAALGVQKHDLVDVEAVAMDVYPTSFIHLVITTSRGVRVFLTTSDGPAAASSRSSGKCLKVVCVRGPPQKERLNEVRAKQALVVPNSAGVAAAIPAGPSTGTPVTRASKTMPGLSIMALSPVDGPKALKETFMALCTDLHMQTPGAHKWQVEPLHEAVDMEILGSDVTGHTWAICEEVNDPSLSKEDKDMLARVNAHVEAEGTLSELVLQHFAPRRRFLVLTSTSLWVLVKNRPVNQMYGLLGGPDQGTDVAVQGFFKRFGLDEACSMSLAIACSSEGSKASQRAGVWLLKEGFGEQGRRLPALAADLARTSTFGASSSNNSSLTSLVLAPPAGGGAASGNSAPSSSLRGTVLALPTPSTGGPDDVVFSGCAEGLVLRTARLLRPFWDLALMDPVSGQFSLRVAELQRLRGPLQLLSHFMHGHAPFRDAVQASLASRRLEELQQSRTAVALVVGRSASAVEASLIVNVYSLVSQTVQALSLFTELQSDGRVVSGLDRNLDASERASLNKLTWADVVVSPEGRTACRALVRAGVEAGMDEDAVERLQIEAPDFFSDGDAMQVVARRELLAAKAQTGSQREAHVGKAAQILIGSFDRSLAGPRPYAWRVDAAHERLEEACARLAELDMQSAGIALCLELAQRCARGPVSQLPISDDFSADESLCWRRRCYDIAFGLLGRMNAGPAQDAAVAKSLTSPDAVWHYALYKWLLINAPDRLVQLSTPFVEGFVKNPLACTLANKHQGENMELYSRWLQAKGRYSEAAKVLLDLARLEVDPDPAKAPAIADRVGYLSRALTVASINVESQRLTREIEDELDLCQLQDTVGQAYLKNPALATEQARLALERSLVRPSRLYNEYAARGELWEECIEIMRVCGFDEDPGELRRLYDCILAPHVRKWDTVELGATVRRLAQRFGSKDSSLETFAFPLDYLVSSLEETSFMREKLGVDEKMARSSSGTSREAVLSKLKWDNRWLVDALADDAVAPWRVFVAYARWHAQVEGRRALYAACALQYVCQVWLNRPGDAAMFDRYVNSALPLSLELGGAADVLERAVFALQGPAADVSRAEAQTAADALKAVLQRMKDQARAR